MNTGTERAALESIYGSFQPVRIEQGQRFAAKNGEELHLVGISRADFIGSDRDGKVAVLSKVGLKEGIAAPRFRVADCVGAVVIRPQTAEEREAEGIGREYAPRYVAETVEFDSFDERGRCVVRGTGVAVSYPLLISAGVND